MIDALIIEAIRRGLPTPARQTADRLDIRELTCPECEARIQYAAAIGCIHECLPEWERALMEAA